MKQPKSSPEVRQIMQKLVMLVVEVAAVIGMGTLPTQADTTSSTPPPVHVNRCDPMLYTNVRESDGSLMASYQRFAEWSQYAHTEAGEGYGTLSLSVGSPVPEYYTPRYTQVPGTTKTANASLTIDYVNGSAKAIKDVDFGLMARGHWVAEVRDEGTFSPGARVNHTLELSVVPLGTAVATCIPLQVIYQDGTTWANPNLPATLQM